jgi:surfeit locus 1 family protein
LLLLDAGAPDGFEREWRPAMRFGPERHLGYAIQWFALALALTVIFVALSLQRTP